MNAHWAFGRDWRAATRHYSVVHDADVLVALEPNADGVVGHDDVALHQPVLLQAIESTQALRVCQRPQ